VSPQRVSGAARLILVLLVAVSSLLADSRVLAQQADHRQAHGVINLDLEGLIRQEPSASRHSLRADLTPRTVAVEVTSSRDVSSAIRALGGTVEADAAGRVTAAQVPVSAIGRLAAVPGVLTIFPSRRVHPYLDKSVPEIRAPEAWALQDSHGLPVRGSGVLIGILDSGIDLHNPDFQNPDGSTRI